MIKESVKKIIDDFIDSYKSDDKKKSDYMKDSLKATIGGYSAEYVKGFLEDSDVKKGTDMVFAKSTSKHSITDNLDTMLGLLDILSGLRTKTKCSCDKCKEKRTVTVILNDGIAEISEEKEGVMVKSKKLKINLVDYTIKDLGDEEIAKKILGDFLK